MNPKRIVEILKTNGSGSYSELKPGELNADTDEFFSRACTNMIRMNLSLCRKNFSYSMTVYHTIRFVAFSVDIIDINLGKIISIIIYMHGL
jgi:hypothetical protein